MVYRGSANRVNPGPSAKENQRAELERRARTPVRGNFRIGVVGKGGVGKTTVAACVGSVLAQLRYEDRVVALDVDTAFGKLGARIDPTTTHSYRQLVTDAHLRSYPDVRSHLGHNAYGLFVLPAHPEHGRNTLTPGVVVDALSRLSPYFGVSLIDCGATMDTPVTRAVAHHLDGAIVVSTPWADGASIAHSSLDWLAAHGSPRLLSRTVVVLNNSDGNVDTQVLTAVGQTFVDRGFPVIAVPFDRALRPGGVVDLDRGMNSRTRHTFLEIAAQLGATFAQYRR